MLIIRLQRTGKKNQADFRIVLAEKTAPVQKKFTEILGSYNPRKKDFKAKEDRLKYWINQHVQISPTVHNLLVSKGLLDKPKVKAFNTPKKEEVKAEAPASASTAEAAAPAEEAPAAVPEAPAAESAPAAEEAKPAEAAPAGESEKSE